MWKGYRNARGSFGEAVSLDEVRRKGIREELLRRLRHASSCSHEARHVISSMVSASSIPAKRPHTREQKKERESSPPLMAYFSFPPVACLTALNTTVSNTPPTRVFTTGIDFVHRLRPSAPWKSEARYAGPEETFCRMPLRICVHGGTGELVMAGAQQRERIVNCQ